MDLILDNLALTLMITGVVLLITEVVIIGFATFVLFFLGLSLILTGISMQVGILPESVKAAFWANTVLASFLAALFWKPLKNMQKPNDNAKGPINTYDHQFVLEEDVDIHGNSEHRYSGVMWKLKSQSPLTKGTFVKVVKTEVGVLWVEEA